MLQATASRAPNLRCAAALASFRHHTLGDEQVPVIARLQEPDLLAWNEGCRLNPARDASDHLDAARVADALASMMTNTGRALRNLKQRVTAATASQYVSP